jgi:hypothetical protein
LATFTSGRSTTRRWDGAAAAEPKKQKPKKQTMQTMKGFAAEAPRAAAIVNVFPETSKNLLDFLMSALVKIKFFF